jgi:FKBP-type peptidyl-prolyl cis-trans isomerase FkpA
MKMFLALSAFVLASSVAIAAPPREPVVKLPLELIIPPKQRLCTMKTASGLGYRVLRASTGEGIGRMDRARVGYIGYLASTGAVFDQSPSAAFPVNGLIPGFTEGLKMMQKGSIYRFCIPAKLGYGAKGAGPIPPNADLVFQVEVLEFLK